jgi:DNA polymerase III subunit delta
MLAKFDQIIKDIQNRRFYPVYFLSGEESYFIDHITDLLINNVLTAAEKDFNMTVMYGRDSGIGSILDACVRYPFMAEYNLVVIKEAQDLKKIDELNPYLENPNPATILVFAHKFKKIDKRTNTYKILDKNACIYTSEKIKEKEIPDWVRRYLGEQNFSIDQKALTLLVEYMANDLSIIINQLDKLVHLKKDSKAITSNDIEQHIGISKEYNVFELQNAIAHKNQAKATKILNYISSNPKAMAIQLITAMLFSFFSKACVLYYHRADQKKTAEAINIPPFFLNDYTQTVSRYQGKLPAVISILKEYDLKSKGVDSVNTDESELVKEMIFRIINI